MLQIHNPLETDFEKIDVDPFWNVGNEVEHLNHKIHSYPAKFPAFITQKAIQYALNDGVLVNTIADIFCGCGTVAFEAKRMGIDFWGCDLNPTAVLIAKAKSFNYSTNTIKCYFEKILSRFDEYIPTYTLTEPVNERINYWFYPREIMELSLLKECILSLVPRNSKYREYFFCAFSNILKSTSKWLTKSIKPQIDLEKTPLRVRQAFINQCKMMEKATMDSSQYPHSKTIIEQKNALRIRRRDFADLIVSSPPYVTSYEYADLHQLSTLWLDYASDYRTLRKDSIGSKHSTFNGNIMQSLNQSGKNVVRALEVVDNSKAKSVAKYYFDMQQITDVCKSVLRQNGMMLMVIGNTEYKGVLIDNVKHLVESMFNSGFDNIFVTKRKITGKILTPYRDEKGKFSSSPDKRKVYSEEFIVIGS